MTRPGNILPLALLITFMMLLTGIGIGTVVLEGSQRAKDTDESVSAYYMADSGIERQLYEIRKKQQSLADIASLSSDYPGGGAWVSTAGLEQVSQKSIPSIADSDFVIFDLFDPDALEASPNIDEIRINWAGNAQLEVGYAQWPVGEKVIWPDTDAFVIRYGFAPSLSIAGLDPTHAYRVRIKAINGTADNITVGTYQNSTPQPFPGNITLSTEGTFGKATQKIAVVMPKQDVLSGVYSFVLFSECQLLKGVGGAPICP